MVTKEQVEQAFQLYGFSCPPEEIFNIFLQYFEGDDADLYKFVRLCDTLMLLNHRLTEEDVARLFNGFKKRSFVINKEIYIYALKSGNVQLLDALASKDRGEFTEEEKEWLVQASIIYGSPDFAERMIDFTDVEVRAYRDSEGNTLLHYAAAAENPEMVKFLLGKGLDLEARNSREATPVCIAAKENTNLEVLKALEEAGADMSVKSNHGENLLITAAGNNPNPEVTEYLLGKKVYDIESVDEAGLTVLQNAALHQSNPDVLRLLVKAGASPYVESYKGDNLLHLAVCNESLEVVKFVASNFTTRSLNDEGESVLQRAVLYGKNPEVVRYILEKNKREVIFGACFNSDPAILESLITRGDFDINTLDSEGRSLMMCAAHVNPNPQVVEMLWNHQAVCNNRSFDGRTLLHYGAANGQEMYDFLLQNKDIAAFSEVKDNEGHKPDYYLTHPEEF
ncbi:MAG: ankyrin repeat domain-containing protein [Treponema sp.]|nr:ankyrin repeat domain-containing protein [Treponema sp.]